MEARNVVMVLGSSPEEKVHPLEVYLDRRGADEHILKGLLGAYANHLSAVEPGGTLSLIVNIGPEPTADSPNPSSSGSFVINNPKGDRHVWDFNTLTCKVDPLG